MSGSDWSQNLWSFWGAFGIGRLITVGDRESLHVTETLKRVKHDCPWLPQAIKFKWTVNKVKPKGLKKVRNCQFNIGNGADMFRQHQVLKLSERIRTHRKSTPTAMTVLLLFGFQLIFALHKSELAWHLWQMSTGTETQTVTASNEPKLTQHRQVQFVPKCHIYTSSEHLQGQWLNHFPEQSTTMFNTCYPFGEVIFLNMHSKSPLAQHEAIFSHHITCYLGEVTPCYSLLSCHCRDW